MLLGIGLFVAHISFDSKEQQNNVVGCICICSNYTNRVKYQDIDGHMYLPKQR
jgi:hypothetical protein